MSLSGLLGALLIAAAAAAVSLIVDPGRPGLIALAVLLGLWLAYALATLFWQLRRETG